MVIKLIVPEDIQGIAVLPSQSFDVRNTAIPVR